MSSVCSNLWCARTYSQKKRKCLFLIHFLSRPGKALILNSDAEEQCDSDPPAHPLTHTPLRLLSHLEEGLKSWTSEIILTVCNKATFILGERRDETLITLEVWRYSETVLRNFIHQIQLQIQVLLNYWVLGPHLGLEDLTVNEDTHDFHVLTEHTVWEVPLMLTYLPILPRANS